VYKKLLCLLLCSLLVFLCSCSSEKFLQDTNANKILEDNKKAYEQDSINEVKELYITVLPTKKKNIKQYTFKDLNESNGYVDGKDIELNVIVQERKNGQSNPDCFGYGLTTTNGTITQRGQSARIAEQKSFKIKLMKEGGLWYGNEVINLNKHPFDKTKMRNKMSFEYFKLVPQIISLRTNFVHLFIKDFSEENYKEEYKDFGLFTQIENLDKNFLKNHGLDSKGALYKAENFEFYRYEDKIKTIDDPDYNEEKFQEILEIKGEEQHQKLITMLDAVNNPLININEVIDKYFDRENYLTWMAINIILDNIDTASRNFCLYSPKDSDKWYFIPWDYDKGWGGYRYSRGEWQQGMTNYWGVVLHKRFLQNKDNVKQLTNKIEELKKIFTREKTKEFVDIYKPIVLEYLNRVPDKIEKASDLNKIIKEIDDMPDLIELNIKRYYESLEKPMPIFMGKVLDYGSYNVFTWNEAYDFNRDYIEYILDISKTPNFESIIYHKDGIRDIQHIVKDLQPGKYFWKLTIKDSKGNIQQPFDIYKVKATESYYFGVQEFYVN